MQVVDSANHLIITGAVFLVLSVVGGYIVRLVLLHLKK